MRDLDGMVFFAESRLALIECVGVMLLAFGLAIICIVEIVS